MIETICRWLVKKYNRNQATFCFCPKCGLELCNSNAWFSNLDGFGKTAEITLYRCVQCGHESGWLFDCPAPILVKGHIK